ncbi:hypothetical protein MHBO_003512 [Bonamia ostreae]|uniref:Uncharacterized protein n=1 Tax=Bonamia ostreae TaxID=126728 RepID=A0ABV2AQN8_9EUKA
MSGNSSTNFEIVTCTGKDKTGALNILYNGIKLKREDEILFENGGKVDFINSELIFAGENGGNKRKRILIANMGFKETNLIREKEGRFVADDRWICCSNKTVKTGNFGSGKVVQICENAIYFIVENNDLNKICDIIWKVKSDNEEIEKAEICYPFILLKYKNDGFEILTFKKSGENGFFDAKKLDLVDKRRVK